MKASLLAGAALLAITIAAFGQGPPGSVPAKVGHASFKFGSSQFSYDKVTGDFMQSYGFSVVMLNFSKDGKPASDHLTVSVMIQKPGAVDLNQPMGNGIGYFTGGKLFDYEKGKSQCTMNVTKLTPTSLEGNAECPVVNEKFGQGKNSLTAVKFSASTN